LETTGNVVVLLERETRGEAETEALGRQLGERLDRGSIWLLTGEMGAGKTVFARGICRGLGVVDPVRSPSFTLVTEHRRGRIPIIHADLYRLETAAAIADLGWDDLTADGAILLVEWGERARSLVGPDRFEVELKHLGGDRRLIRLAAWGPAGSALGRDLTAGLAGVAGMPSPC
jgi:tRNA threonylcarbamoyladenosine biosynthesis protein TsaE